MPASPFVVPGRSVLTFASVLLLVGIEVFAVALAGGWALAGLFELGDVWGYAMMGALSLIGLYVMVAFWQRAVAIESGRER